MDMNDPQPSAPNLSLGSLPPHLLVGHALGGTQVPQLPPQMFITAAQLMDITDKKIMAILRDNQKILGVLRSWDQFGNVLMTDCVERIDATGIYAEIPRGVYIIRGENISMLCEIDLDKEDTPPPGLTLAPVEEVYALMKKEKAERKVKQAKKEKALANLGFVPEYNVEI
ncbi:hypothetical protein K432DRAFT_413131 [Lepidopterella palustris CBS 459.81]|uniref:U6 snRNA-associated Sm-like protein LSm1 n=1 Tax=Lepidopterella palustris CBS 459.81 TaxID=1314670 RepID=A0A8E2EL25_9PEZI|nr:hypothetical protein K432DRAFT_413131 [Lepidopterella palustris CBS 459.81]